MPSIISSAFSPSLPSRMRGLCLQESGSSLPRLLADLFCTRSRTASLRADYFFVQGSCSIDSKIGENHLHGRARGMWLTAALFVLGAWGLAGCWPFGTLLGESMISEGASAVHQNWLPYLFIFVEAITAGAILRVFFRIFFGWGKPAPTDEASQVEERSETKEHERTPLMMFFPAAALILIGISFIAIPSLRSVAEANAARFTDQGNYLQSVLQNVEPPAPREAPSESLASSILRTTVAGILALLLSLGTVFRSRLGTAFHFTRSLELGNAHLRKIHSGHPGDYVAWLTIGTAVLGGSFLCFLR